MSSPEPEIYPSSSDEKLDVEKGPIEGHGDVEQVEPEFDDPNFDRDAALEFEDDSPYPEVC